ncbi:hypothetical protein [Legionella sp.]|uniref:hypothetical protein n=1 Tax=Legionella sp. TaxID=459 RepID=UPI003C9BDE56
MKVTLSKEDYESISIIVRKQLLQLMPDNELNKGQIIFGPEFMAIPLRISTPSTQFKFDEKQLEFVSIVRKNINESNESHEKKLRKIQQLESIILFGQLLFSQSASLHFLQKNTTQPLIEAQLEKLRKLIHKDGIQYNFSKFEVLSQRKAFNNHLGIIKCSIKKAPLNPVEKSALLKNLYKAQKFYYQANDFNFKYANKPSRSFSNFLDQCERFGSKTALAASIIAIGATALALIPPLTPIMGPIALITTIIALAINIPLAMKSLGTMFYNLINFGAAPKPSELINAVGLATGVVLLGTGSLITQAINTALTGPSATLLSQGIPTSLSTGKVILDLRGEINRLSAQKKAHQYKSDLKKLKEKQEQVNDISSMQKL